MKIINRDEMCAISGFKWPELEDAFADLNEDEVAEVTQDDIGEFNSIRTFRGALSVYHRGKYRTKMNPRLKVLYVWKRENPELLDA
ncbi:hypothetical protein LCGC14_1037340 [marine sediment metagenome]|uniref:Uncharacterized protein n=1 Tax=marine sediment metagenome TaxID=412755 RepID=A0A0F9QYZ4_9ZZZZ